MSVLLAALNAKGHRDAGYYLEFVRKECLVQQSYHRLGLRMHLYYRQS